MRESGLFICILKTNNIIPTCPPRFPTPHPHLPDGRTLAKEVACKFIETSSGIDHHVNELLVGIVAQVQLNPVRLLNLSKKQRQQLANNGALNTTTAAATTQPPSSSSAPKEPPNKALTAVYDDDDDEPDASGCCGGGAVGGSSGGGGGGGAVATVVEAHPLPRTARENHLFTAGGRPYGQRVVLSIKQPNKPASSTTSAGKNANALSSVNGAAGTPPDAGRRRHRETSTHSSPSSSSTTSSTAENRSPHRGRAASSSAGDVSAEVTSGSPAASGSSGAEKTTAAAAASSPSSSPVSRISLRTKYLLTSFMKFRRTLRSRRRNAGSCSDLFVI